MQKKIAILGIALVVGGAREVLRFHLDELRKEILAFEESLGT